MYKMQQGKTRIKPLKVGATRLDGKETQSVKVMNTTHRTKSCTKETLNQGT